MQYNAQTLACALLCTVQQFSMHSVPSHLMDCCRMHAVALKCRPGSTARLPSKLIKSILLYVLLILPCCPRSAACLSCILRTLGGAAYSMLQAQQDTGKEWGSLGQICKSLSVRLAGQDPASCWQRPRPALLHGSPHAALSHPQHSPQRGPVLQPLPQDPPHGAGTLAPRQAAQGPGLCLLAEG